MSELQGKKVIFLFFLLELCVYEGEHREPALVSNAVSKDRSLYCPQERTR